MIAMTMMITITIKNSCLFCSSASMIQRTAQKEHDEDEEGEEVEEEGGKGQEEDEEEEEVGVRA